MFWGLMANMLQASSEAVGSVNDVAKMAKLASEQALVEQQAEANEALIKLVGNDIEKFKKDQGMADEIRAALLSSKDEA